MLSGLREAKQSPARCTQGDLSLKTTQKWIGMGLIKLQEWNLQQNVTTVLRIQLQLDDTFCSQSWFEHML